MTQSVLVVEDDELTQFVLVEMCRELGFECDTADNGQEAVTKLTSAPDGISLVLMDIHMPRYSGIDAVSAIRSHPVDPPKELPIVAVTADVGWHDPDLCQRHGFDSVLSKPVNFELLSRTLKQFSARLSS